MDKQTLYGLVLLCYIAPYLVWMIAREQRLEILKQFYPGRADEKTLERAELTLGAIWIVGLLPIILGWSLRWNPAPMLMLIAVIWIVGILARRAFKASRLLETKYVRAIVATPVVWSAVIAGWYVIFGERYGFDPAEAVLIALVPIPIGLLAYGAFLWVKKGKSNSEA